MYKAKNESFCSRRCRSVEHADEISSAILRGNEDQAIAFMCWRCSNYGRVTDEAGRTALHIASSCGKTKVVDWILKSIDHEACLNAKDYESGYTPLHRSLFHGQLSTARSLIKHGAKMNALDHDGLMPLDHLMKDRPSKTNSSSTTPCEVYVWGSNSNFNLGIGNHQIRRFPDTVDHFRKNNISIKKVAMGKFHSIFVSHDGRAFSCGHGQGGRLGLDSEETVMTPNHINLNPHHSGSRLSDTKHVVISASVGQDHSMILTEKGTIYTFGMNDHYQLGHNPPPPFQLSPKALAISLNHGIGVHAAHYHSVAWSSMKLYSWGLNCGQLGHPKGDKWQKIPKSMVLLRGVEFVAVAAGDGATVIASGRGEVYILQAYCYRKIGFSLGLVSRIEVSGGRLDPTLIKSEDVSAWGDYRNGEDDLKVVIINDAKKIMVWQSSTGQFARCNLHVGSRNVNAVDACLGMNKLLVVTDEGEGFEAEFKIKKKSEEVILSSSPVDQTLLQKLVEKDASLDFYLKRIAFVHRAVSVFCDPKGCNFSVIQEHPNVLTKKPEAGHFISLETSLLSLLEEAQESDFISDVVFCIGDTRIPAHRYILECSSKNLASLIASAEKAQNSSSLQDDNADADRNFNLRSHSVVTIKLEDVHPIIFKELLKFVYTGVCDFCLPGQWSPEKDIAYLSFFISDKEMDKGTTLERNCETVDQGSAKEKLTSKASSAKVKFSCSNKVESENNPVNDARRAAVRFGLNDMVKQMDGLHYNKNKCMIYRKSSSVESHDEKTVANISLNPNCCSHLYDVVIECSEGKLISAHKCILSMRSKYFETMLQGNWLECSGQRNLTLPFPYEVMETILMYLYQNKVPFLNKSEDLSFICHVLVAADQILLEGLKEICEISLANHVTLKNVSELYQMSDTYNALKLKTFCMDYICHNLSALLESRALDSIGSELFDDIQMCYWGMRPVVLDRSIALPNKYPDLALLQSIWESVGIPSEEEHFKQSDRLCKSPSKKEVVDASKRNKSKKKQRSKQNSIDESIEHFSRLSLGSTPGSDVETSLDRFCSLEMDNSDIFEESLQITCQDGSEKDLCQFNLELKLEDNHSTPIRNQNCNEMESKLENKISSVIDEEFPLLTGDSHSANLSVPAKVPKQRKIAKLSQKARKKLLTSSGIANEPINSPQDTSKPEVNAWKRLKSTSQEEISQGNLEVQSLSEIMNEERMRHPKTKRLYQDESPSEENKFFSLFASNANIESGQSSMKTTLSKSNHWPTQQSLNECQVTGQKTFDEIMADELKQREITKKIMEKSLNLTQIEDRAIKELQLLYEREYEFDQRITVKRHCSAQASRPVWITSKSP